MSDKINNNQKEISNDIHLIISTNKSSRKAFLYAQEAGYFEADSSYNIALDSLDSFLMLYVVSGDGKLIYDNNEYHLCHGDLFFIDCKKHYEYSAADNKRWYVHYFYFNGRQARGYYDILTNNKSPVFKVQDHKSVKSLFWQIVFLNSKNNKYAEPITSLHITRILTHLCMLNGNESDLNVEFPPYIHYVFNHIERFYDEKITLDLLAEIYSISKFHLAREFKRCSGQTIHDYLITTRINKAKSLLRYSDKSIEKIATEVGCYSSSHFIKLFTSREDVTPNVYRKQWTK
ncbi:MAG: AraC family transcriptional regulator [Eubacteriales bacterium]|nr:AraC family transcriptional regulator [Eubacteriales bacterium]